MEAALPLRPSEIGDIVTLGVSMENRGDTWSPMGAPISELQHRFLGLLQSEGLFLPKNWHVGILEPRVRR